VKDLLTAPRRVRFLEGSAGHLPDDPAYRERFAALVEEER
jgi:hypothetical protein